MMGRVLDARASWVGARRLVQDGAAHPGALRIAEVDLDWRDYVVQDPALVRRTEIRYSRGDPGKALRELEWQANLTMPGVIKQMVAALSRPPAAAALR